MEPSATLKACMELDNADTAMNLADSWVDLFEDEEFKESIHEDVVHILFDIHRVIERITNQEVMSDVMAEMAS